MVARKATKDDSPLNECTHWEWENLGDTHIIRLIEIDPVKQLTNYIIGTLKIKGRIDEILSSTRPTRNYIIDDGKKD